MQLAHLRRMQIHLHHQTLMTLAPLHDNSLLREIILETARKRKESKQENEFTYRHSGFCSSTTCCIQSLQSTFYPYHHQYLLPDPTLQCKHLPRSLQLRRLIIEMLDIFDLSKFILHCLLNWPNKKVKLFNANLELYDSLKSKMSNISMTITTSSKLILKQKNMLHLKLATKETAQLSLWKTKTEEQLLKNWKNLIWRRLTLRHSLFTPSCPFMIPDTNGLN